MSTNLGYCLFSSDLQPAVTKGPQCEIDSHSKDPNHLVQLHASHGLPVDYRRDHVSGVFFEMMSSSCQDLSQDRLYGFRCHAIPPQKSRRQKVETAVSPIVAVAALNPSSAHKPSIPQQSHVV